MYCFYFTCFDIAYAFAIRKFNSFSSFFPKSKISINDTNQKVIFSTFTTLNCRDTSSLRYLTVTDDLSK